MLKNIASKQTSVGLGIGRSQVLILGVTLTLIGLVGVSSWLRWLQTTSRPQFTDTGDLALATNANNQPIWRIDLSTGAVMPLTLSDQLQYK